MSNFVAQSGLSKCVDFFRTDFRLQRHDRQKVKLHNSHIQSAFAVCAAATV